MANAGFCHVESDPCRFLYLVGVNDHGETEPRERC
jgi:hypothetical protein